MANIVPCYGVHWDEEGTAFLEQGRSGTNAVGLKKRSPFQVRLEKGRRHCNHQMPLSAPVPNDNQMRFFEDLFWNDDLVRAAAPVPKQDGGMYFLEQTPRLQSIFSLLSRMSSPIHPIVLPAWSIDDRASLLTELGNTNVQPYFVYDAEVKHSSLLSDVARAGVSLPRKLIVAGSDDMVLNQAFTKIDTKLDDEEFASMDDLQALPWETLGAQILKKYMRRELRRGR